MLDNEAVQALRAVGHPKHGQVVAHVQVVAQRKRKAIPLTVVVPTAVRVEAGWDRRTPSAALINRLRITDLPLDTVSADVAADLAARLHVSVADAQLGASMRLAAADGAVTVITSDPEDIAAVSDPLPVTIVAI